MPVPNEKALKSRILLLFAKRALWSAQELHDALQSKGVACSVQAVYRELRALIAENILHKVGRAYVLNTHWILRMQAFVNSAARASFSEEGGLFLQRRKQTWRFGSLLDMDILWGHIVFYFLRQAERKILLGWQPYMWIYLMHGENEERFQRSLRFMGGQFYLMTGDCFVNRWALPFMRRDKINFSLTPGPFRAQTGVYFSVTGDHIVTVKLKPETARRLDDIFRTSKTIETLPVGELTEIFIRQGHCTLTLEHNPKKAKALRNQFSQHLGEDFG